MQCRVLTAQYPCRFPSFGDVYTLFRGILRLPSSFFMSVCVNAGFLSGVGGGGGFLYKCQHKPATPVLSNSPTCAFSYTCGTNHTESVSDASLALLQVTVEVCGSETEVQRNWVKGGALARRAPAKQRLGSSPICRQYLPMATS